MNDHNPQLVKHLKSTAYDLRDIFENALTVGQISESLISRNDTDPAGAVRQFMEAQDFDVLGVSQNGSVAGYVRREELSEGSCGQFIQTFAPGDILADSTSLFQVLRLLREQQRYFVLTGNKVAGIVMRGDLQKAPVRMLLFSLVTLAEMHLLKVIQLTYPDDTWQVKLKPSRLQKAKEFLAIRQSRNEDMGLADCLQLGDKFDLIQEQQIIKYLGFSKTKVGKLKEKTNGLRDRLAHGQDLVAGSSWEEVIDTASELESLLLQLETIITEKAV